MEALCYNNEKIELALNNSEFCIDALGGASQLTQKLYESNNTIFDYSVFLDSDDAGRETYTEVNNLKLLDILKITFATCPGKPNSELEDLIDYEIYIDRINESYQTHFTKDAFKSMEKWS